MTLPEFDDDISVVTFLSEEAAKALREAQAKLEETVDQAIFSPSREALLRRA